MTNSWKFSVEAVFPPIGLKSVVAPLETNPVSNAVTFIVPPPSRNVLSMRSGLAAVPELLTTDVLLTKNPPTGRENKMLPLVGD